MKEREFYLKTVVRYNEQLSKTHENINRNANKIIGILGDIGQPTIRNNRSLEEAIEARQLNRTTERQLTSVFQYFGNKLKSFKRRIDKANKSLFGAIIDKFKNLKTPNSSASELDIVNRSREELLDNLMPENHYYVDQEEKVDSASEIKPKRNKGKPKK